MVDILSAVHNNSGSLVPYHTRLPQAAGQEVDSARPMVVAPPASCQHNQPINILRLPDVIKRVGLKRAAIYLRLSQGNFPKQISLGARAVGWLESEIDAWLAARVQQARILTPH